MHDSMNTMSEEAETVLKMMRAGSALVGSIGDYGRPFRLERDDTWDNVGFSIVQELVEGGKITRAADRGAGQMEYRAAAMSRYLFWAVLCKRQGCRHSILLKYLGPEEACYYELPPRPLMTSMHIPCEVCGETALFGGDDLQAVRQPLDAPPSDFVDRI